MTTGLSFAAPERVRFKYQLVGLDNDWVDAGTRRAIYFSHLPPGQYTFCVIAANGDGIWNTAGATTRIIVLPPFYRTWWFISANSRARWPVPSVEQSSTIMISSRHGIVSNLRTTSPSVASSL